MVADASWKRQRYLAHFMAHPIARTAAGWLLTRGLCTLVAPPQKPGAVARAGHADRTARSREVSQDTPVVRFSTIQAVGTLALEERETPSPGYEEILLKTAAVGICGTDARVFDREFEGAVSALPAHEATGVIVACAIRGWDVLPRRLGGRVRVSGAWARGLLMAQLARNAGASTVTIVDVNELRLKTAEDCGVEFRDTVPDDAERDKWDVVMGCTGNIRAVEDGLTRVKRTGFSGFWRSARRSYSSVSPISCLPR